LLLVFHVRPASQPTITGVALCHKKVGGPWTGTDHIIKRCCTNESGFVVSSDNRKKLRSAKLNGLKRKQPCATFFSRRMSFLSHNRQRQHSPCRGSWAVSILLRFIVWPEQLLRTQDTELATETTHGLPKDVPGAIANCAVRMSVEAWLQSSNSMQHSPS
jgi:hypothetical protein